MNSEQIFTIGFVIFLVGIVLLILTFVKTESRNRKEGLVVFFIGPIPIIFGSKGVFKCLIPVILIIILLTILVIILL